MRRHLKPKANRQTAIPIDLARILVNLQPTAENLKRQMQRKKAEIDAKPTARASFPRMGRLIISGYLGGRSSADVSDLAIATIHFSTFCRESNTL
ncbi:hypothetical protein ACTXT7_000377 [Hymenolepis weldensis]